MIVGFSSTGDSVITGSSFRGESDGESTNTGESINSGESIGVGESTGVGDSTDEGESTEEGESKVSVELIRSGDPSVSFFASSIASAAIFTVASELSVSVNLLFLISSGSAEIGESVIIPLPFCVRSIPRLSIPLIKSPLLLI